MRVTIYHLNIGMITMSRIFEAIAVVLSIGLAAMYFTTANPNVQALTEDEAHMMYTIIQRVQNIEKQKGIKVPDNLKFTFNGSPEK